MAEEVGGFFYKLGIDTDDAEKGLKKLKKAGIIVGIGLTALTGGAKLLGDEFIKIDRQAQLFGQDAQYIYRVRQEFEQLNLTAEEGSAYIGDMSDMLRKLKLRGEFKTGLGFILGKDTEKLTGITDIDEATALLRKSIGQDKEKARAFAQEAGISESSLVFLMKRSEEVAQARSIATERASRVDVNRRIEQSKLLGQELVKLKEELKIFATDMIPVATRLVESINSNLVPALETTGKFLELILVPLYILGKGLEKFAELTGLTKLLNFALDTDFGSWEKYDPSKSLQRNNLPELPIGTMGSVQDYIKSMGMGNRELAGANGSVINNYNNISVPTSADVGTALRSIENQTGVGG